MRWRVTVKDAGGFTFETGDLDTRGLRALIAALVRLHTHVELHRLD